MWSVYPGPVKAISRFGIADAIGARTIAKVARLPKAVPHPVQIAVLDDTWMRECLLVVQLRNTLVVRASPIDCVLRERVLDDINGFVAPLDLHPSRPRYIPHAQLRSLLEDRRGNSHVWLAH